MNKAVGITVKQLDVIRSPFHDKSEFGFMSTFVSQKVEITEQKMTDDDDYVGDAKTTSCFYVSKSAFSRRFHFDVDLFDDFDVEFPELCFLIPGWEQTADRKNLYCPVGWSVDVSDITDRNTIQANNVHVVTKIEATKEAAEALAIYINAYCDNSDFVILCIPDDGCDIEELQNKYKEAFGEIGFGLVEGYTMLKDCRTFCKYFDEFNEADYKNRYADNDKESAQ